LISGVIFLDADRAGVTGNSSAAAIIALNLRLLFMG
jgi:hypothetical protein